MITYHDGDLLKSGCDIICHQVNLQGVMGGGLAYQIAQKHPECAKQYAEYVKLFSDPTMLICSVFWHHANEYAIANCFSQLLNFDTSYVAVREVFKNVKSYAEILNKTVGIPYGYGCGIAHGEWAKVERIIKEVFEKSDVDCQIWRLK